MLQNSNDKKLLYNTREAAKNHFHPLSANAKFDLITFAYRTQKICSNLPNKELLDLESILLCSLKNVTYSKIVQNSSVILLMVIVLSFEILI